MHRSFQDLLLHLATLNLFLSGLARSEPNGTALFKVLPQADEPSRIAPRSPAVTTTPAGYGEYEEA